MKEIITPILMALLGYKLLQGLGLIETKEAREARLKAAKLEGSLSETNQKKVVKDGKYTKEEIAKLDPKKIAQRAYNIHNTVGTLDDNEAQLISEFKMIKSQLELKMVKDAFEQIYDTDMFEYLKDHYNNAEMASVQKVIEKYPK